MDMKCNQKFQQHNDQLGSPHCCISNLQQRIDNLSMKSDEWMAFMKKMDMNHVEEVEEPQDLPLIDNIVKNLQVSWPFSLQHDNENFDSKRRNDYYKGTRNYIGDLRLFSNNQWLLAKQGYIPWWLDGVH